MDWRIQTVPSYFNSDAEHGDRGSKDSDGSSKDGGRGLKDGN